MSSREETYSLVVGQMSTDNQQRILTEQAFNYAVAQDPSQIFGNLIQIASDESIDRSFRQSSLLHLKRLVPKYWSAAFPSFVGPSCISQEMKSSIRTLLMQLIYNQDSKIRSSASYAIIQISLVDYPDEWPTLLDDLYSLIGSNDFYKMLGSLTVLKDLFDDLVTDEQFFEGGIGEIVLNNCSSLLINNSVPLEIKIETIKLFEICLVQLSSQLNLNANRKVFVKKVVSESVELSLSLLREFTQLKYNSSILSQVFKFEIYRCLNSISNNFNHLFWFKMGSNTDSLMEIIVGDLQLLNNIKFQNSNAFGDYQDLLKIQMTTFEIPRFMSELVSELLLFVTLLSSKFTFTNKLELLQIFINTLIDISTLPESVKEDWDADFNSFVTLESGLTIDVHIRNAVQDYLIDLTHDLELIFNEVYVKFTSLQQQNVSWQGSVLFLMGALFQNEETMNFSNSLVDFLNALLSLLSNSQNEFLTTRLILIMPRFFSKFENQIDSQSFGLKTLEELFKYQSTELTKAAILFSFTYFNYFLRSSAMTPTVQTSIIKIISELTEDSDEDTNLILLESLSVAICIDNVSLSKTTDTLELILKICYKDSSNLGLVDSGRECLTDLLKNLSDEDFLRQCDRALPTFVQIMNDSLKDKLEFTPALDLSLEFLITFVDVENPLTQQIFNYIFPPLTQLILYSDDDQLLQISNEVFNNILNHDVVTSYIASFDHGMEILLQIVSKYLSPSLSDQAILNVGDLITKLIKNFANDSNVSQYLVQILQTVTKRLIIAKEFPTIENLILIFANLAITSPQQTLDFLSNFDINGNEKLITLVIPIWLQTFETVRGYNKIVLNVKALSAIFMLKDPRLNTISVNSDELVPNELLEGKIITRSMRKNLQFVQIPAPVKIIKLFINELKFQLSQPGLDTVKNAIGLMGNKLVDEPQDDEWEDLNEYEEFAQFDNDDDDEDEDHDHDHEHGNEHGSTSDNTEELQILRFFFKEIGGDEYFKQVYEYLKEDEKKVLLEFVSN